MESELEVVVSGVVTSAAATVAGTSAETLQHHAAVTVPPDSTVLIIDCTDTSATTAQRSAQALAESYVAYRAPQAAVISGATLPRSAPGPNYLLNGAAALAVGVLLGVLSALLRDRRDDRVRGPRDLVERTDLPLVATVPLTPAEAADAGGRLPVVDAPGSSAAEAYRRLRGRIARAARGRNDTTVTLVTSPVQDDGAASVAANTAVALALTGEQVLLLEADLRCPRLGEMFGVPDDGGLGRVLAGEASLTDSMRPTRVPHLRLLPAGADVPSAPGELFDDAAVEKVLGAVPAGVDHVVIAAPPVLRAAETSALAAHAHLLVLVVSTGSTRREDVRAALREVAEFPARLLGGVLCQRVGGSRRSGAAAPAGAAPDGGPAEVERPAPARAEDHDRVPEAG
jgi:capsular exopolysaccharide synthesis family protein